MRFPKNVVCATSKDSDQPAHTQCWKSHVAVKQYTCLDADSVLERIALSRSQNGKVNCVLT